MISWVLSTSELHSISGSRGVTRVILTDHCTRAHRVFIQFWSFIVTDNFVSHSRRHLSSVLKGCQSDTTHTSVLTLKVVCKQPIQRSLRPADARAVSYCLVWYRCRGVGGKWTRNTHQSVPPLLFTQGPNLEFTRENIIHTKIQINNNDIIRVVNNNID